MDFRWAVWNELATGSLPRTLKDVQDLSGQGIRAVLSLHRPAPGVSEALRNAGIQHVIAELEDFSVPSFEQMHGMRMMMQAWREAGKPLYVHCYAGIGRCRTVAASFLALEIGSADEAVERVGTPETREQLDFVRDYFAHRP